MLVDLRGRDLLRKPADQVDLSDLIGGGRTGPASWWEDPNSGVTYLNMPWAPDPAPAEVDRVRVRLTTANAIEEDLVLKAQTAITNNNTFLAIPGTPTNAQILAQVRLLTRENTALIRLVMRWLDSNEGT